MNDVIILALTKLLGARMKTFLTNCVSGCGDSINEMKEDAEDIEYEEFTTEVGEAELADFVKEHFSEYDNMEEWKKDWHISYYKGSYQGKECVYFTHSMIEYIFC